MNGLYGYRALAASLVLGYLLAPALAFAEVLGDCAALGVALTEHSCFHAEHGPFTTVMATAGSGATAQTPNIDAIHTEYRIGLTGEYSVVTYTPQRTGAWAVLLGAEVPLQVIAGKADAQPPLLEQSRTTGCRALPVLRVFQLEASTKYRFVFGPTPARVAVAVVEFVHDFLTPNGRDEDGDGFGSKAEIVVTPCQPPVGFAPNTRDCDDRDPLVHPGAEEACDGVDRNCNGVADDVGLACRVGAGACRAEGKTACEGQVASCSAELREGVPERCNGLDDDCNGVVDDGARLCAEAATPACVRAGTSARCGCQLDLDCGGALSGRVCNAELGVCEDGCSVAAGRNGCSEGEQCNERTSRCELVTSEGGAGGVSPMAGTSPGAAATAMAGTASGGRATSGLEAPSSARDGCDCVVAGRRGPQGGWALVVTFGVCLLRRRRRLSERVGVAALLSVTLGGCGGRVQDTLAATESDSGRGGLSNRAGAGGVPGGSEPCVPELGEQPRAHACSHVTNGPFVPVVTGAGLQPPDISQLHHTYEVQVVGEGAALRYRAQRGGAHAFMTDTPARWSSSSDGQTFVTGRDFPVQSCAHLTRASVYELAAGQEYELRLEESALQLQVFVEHLAAFGDAAWSNTCDEQEE